jgi:hypothetical protein
VTDVDPTPLMRELSALPSDEMRVQRWWAWLETTPTEEAIDMMSLIVARAHDKIPIAQTAMLSLLQALRRDANAVAYDRLEAIYALAAERGEHPIKRLLLEGRARKTLPLDGAPDNEAFDRTLGERKQLAMSTNRDVIDRLMRDRNPHVIRILLSNPRLVERDVVRIAAMRPASLDVLRTIVDSPKWIARYAVKKALVCNPYTPENTAVSLLPFLLVSDLRMIATMSTLSEGLRIEAHDRVNRAGTL